MMYRDCRNTECLLRILMILPQRNHHGSTKEEIWGGDCCMSRLHYFWDIMQREKKMFIPLEDRIIIWIIGLSSQAASGLDNWCRKQKIWGWLETLPQEIYGKFWINPQVVLQSSIPVFKWFFRYSSRPGERAMGTWALVTSRLPAQQISTRNTGWHLKDKEGTFYLPHLMQLWSRFSGGLLPLLWHTWQLVAVQDWSRGRVPSPQQLQAGRDFSPEL